VFDASSMTWSTLVFGSFVARRTVIVSAPDVWTGNDVKATPRVLSVNFTPL
jgi:hypothetical protein